MLLPLGRCACEAGFTPFEYVGSEQVGMGSVGSGRGGAMAIPFICGGLNLDAGGLDDGFQVTLTRFGSMSTYFGYLTSKLGNLGGISHAR
jgi:hypothetical protein